MACEAPARYALRPVEPAPHSVCHAGSNLTKPVAVVRDRAALATVARPGRLPVTLSCPKTIAQHAAHNHTSLRIMGARHFFASWRLGF
jgi:hypothetical protein